MPDRAHDEAVSVPGRGGARAPVSAAERADALFKTFVEAALLIALSLVHLAFDLSVAALLGAMALLVAATLAADSYLFGSIGRAFAVRRSFHFKLAPFLVAGAVLLFLLPRDDDADKLVIFALAAGLGGVVTGLLNLDGGSASRA